MRGQRRHGPDLIRQPRGEVRLPQCNGPRLVDGSELTAAEVEFGRLLHDRKRKNGCPVLTPADTLAVLAECGYTRPQGPAAPAELALALARHRQEGRGLFPTCSQVLALLTGEMGYVRPDA